MWLCDFFMYEEKVIVNFDNMPAYSIIFHNDFNGLQEALSSLGLNNRRFMIISDSNVSSLYLDELSNIISPLAKKLVCFTFEAGESSKNLDTVSQAYNMLIREQFDRNDILIALGGGVTGDLTGFVAATYLRGIEYIQVPTTLLSMVDSSIGGKTGVDFKSYKNMIGAFHQPKLVYMNLSTLNSLPKKEFNAGMGEIIKHGLIKDSAYYFWLNDIRNNILSLDYELLKQMIIRSCLIKKDVVEKDPNEKGDRALLNFGHTIGHAIEKLMDFKLLHGECIAIGMVAAAYISHKRDFISKDELDNIINSIKEFGLPTKVKGLNPEDIYSVTKLDKKMESDKIKFILLKKIGSACIDTSVSKDEMIEASKFVIE